MTYKISGTIVIDNNNNVNAVGITSALNFVGKGMIEAGSVCYFFQAAAPTGFTKLVSVDDATLRVVSGTGGGTGGITNFTTAFPASPTPLSFTQSYGTSTLTVPQLPSHAHPNGANNSDVNARTTIPGPRSFPATGSTGSNDAHPHSPSTIGASLDLRVQYIDIISASRDA